MDPSQLDINSLIVTINSFVTAPTWKAIASIVGVVLLCFVYLTAFITKFLYDKNKRESDAYLEALRIKKEQEENLSRMQSDSTIALIENMDIAYQQDYLYYVKQIKAQNYKAIYVKIAVQFHEKIAEFLYNEELSPEQRSARIISEVRLRPANNLV